MICRTVNKTSCVIVPISLCFLPQKLPRECISNPEIVSYKKALVLLLNCCDSKTCFLFDLKMDERKAVASWVRERQKSNFFQLNFFKKLESCKEVGYFWGLKKKIILSKHLWIIFKNWKKVVKSRQRTLKTPNRRTTGLQIPSSGGIKNTKCLVSRSDPFFVGVTMGW